MMKTVILICALGIARPDCSIDTAMSVIQGPDATSLASCGFVGQAYLAETAFADYVREDHYLKILCTSDDRREAKPRIEPDHQDLAETADDGYLVGIGTSPR